MRDFKPHTGKTGKLLDYVAVLPAAVAKDDAGDAALPHLLFNKGDARGDLRLKITFHLFLLLP